jgi:hypothetical protein
LRMKDRNRSSLHLSCEKMRERAGRARDGVYTDFPIPTLFEKMAHQPRLEVPESNFPRRTGSAGYAASGSAGIRWDFALDAEPAHRNRSTDSHRIPGGVGIFETVAYLGLARHMPHKQTEATIGLMRQLPEAPPYAIEFIITRLALELRERRFELLSLGMAPLAGLVRTPLSSRWHRMAGMMWEHGGPIYNFQGLRSFKNKFRPTWEPRYLAASGLIGPFITLADVATLAGGMLGRSSAA